MASTTQPFDSAEPVQDKKLTQNADTDNLNMTQDQPTERKQIEKSDKEEEEVTMIKNVESKVHEDHKGHTDDTNPLTPTSQHMNHEFLTSAEPSSEPTLRNCQEIQSHSSSDSSETAIINIPDLIHIEHNTLTDRGIMHQEEEIDHSEDNNDENEQPTINSKEEHKISAKKR